MQDVSINEKVDIITSEWMGYMLLHENMLPSIIFSKDKWLTPGGLILPSHASVLLMLLTSFWKFLVHFSELIPAHMEQHILCHKGLHLTKQLLTHSSNLDHYMSVKIVGCHLMNINEYEYVALALESSWGYLVSAMLQLAKHSSLREPYIEIIPRENVVTRLILVTQILNSCYSFCPVQKNAILQHGINIDFEHPRKKQEMGSDEEIMLSTAPGKAPTHWKQTVLYLYDPMPLNKGQKIAGCVTVSRSKENRRFLDIRLEFSVGGRTRVKVAEMR
ncbi:hypothetical protein OPV22_007030 [Ensete ventricosum]|uniref:Protein arginine N-methyltransferase domain-containing protein n=1 Tax=Ensete ventricosum TaxID=4639 RepID=A0AAV8RQX1_ENSVE|nr:hypothetical protein OPV22_007030 [Ensete ventricosum]